MLGISGHGVMRHIAALAFAVGMAFGEQSFVCFCFIGNRLKYCWESISISAPQVNSYRGGAKSHYNPRKSVHFTGTQVPTCYSVLSRYSYMLCLFLETTPSKVLFTRA